MNLKEFIKETIQGIVEATAELQDAFDTQGVVINPPVSTTERDLYRRDDTRSTYRRVETIEFDVAVTASSGKEGGGKAGLRVFAAELGVAAGASRKNEEVSRVRFSIPIALSPADVEQVNLDRSREMRRKHDDALGLPPSGGLAHD